MSTNEYVATWEQVLRNVARQFRGAKDDEDRTIAADTYAGAVDCLIKTNSWTEIPPLEDQLPDEWMPAAFFTHWRLRPDGR